MRCRCRFKSTAVIRDGARVVRSFIRLPIGIKRGRLVGPKLTTLIAYLKGVCHASFSTIRKFIRDVVHLTISRGQLSAIIGKVTRALEQPYQELLGLLPNEERVNVDETGHKQNRLRMWTWCFRAELYTYTLFKIDPNRNTRSEARRVGQ